VSFVWCNGLWVRKDTHAKDSDLRRVCFADVVDDANIEELLAQTGQLPEVAQVSLPTERRLVL
jgi:hypothetical protein